jgi:hypothetical protein
MHGGRTRQDCRRPRHDSGQLGRAFWAQSAPVRRTLALGLEKHSMYPVHRDRSWYQRRRENSVSPFSPFTPRGGGAGASGSIPPGSPLTDSMLGELGRRPGPALGVEKRLVVERSPLQRRLRCGWQLMVAGRKLVTAPPPHLPLRTIRGGMAMGGGCEPAASGKMPNSQPSALSPVTSGGPTEGGPACGEFHVPTRRYVIQQVLVLDHSGVGDMQESLGWSCGRHGLKGIPSFPPVRNAHPARTFHMLPVFDTERTSGRSMTHLKVAA